MEFSTDVTGHAVLPHTADVIVEAWAPSRTGCLEELVRGVVETFADTRKASAIREIPLEVNAALDEDVVVALLEDVLYLLDADGFVVIDVALEEDEENGSFEGTFWVALVDDVASKGAPPKGVSRSELFFGPADSMWRTRVVLDV